MGFESPETYAATFYKGVLAELQFPFGHDKWGDYASGFKSKYGDPTSVESQTYRNMMGATWSGERLVWKRGTQHLTLLQYADKIDLSKLLLMDDPLASAVARAFKESQAESGRTLIE